jgi:hypothetical protein
MQKWAEDLHRGIAAAIKSARANRSAQWLADETQRLGYPVSRAAIANYESGRKKGLDIAELLVLAAALRIPPLALLFPQLPDGAVELLPCIETTSWNAASWFSGEASSPNPDHDPWPRSKEFELLDAIRRRRTLILAKADFVEHPDWLARPGIDDRQAFAAGMVMLSQDITKYEQLIRENGGVINDE